MTQNFSLDAYRRANAQVNFHAQSGVSSAQVTADGTLAAGDVVGGRLHFENAGGFNENGILMNLQLTDYGAVGGQVDVFLYREEPAAILNNAAFAESEADGLNRVGIVSIGAAEWVSIGAGIKTVFKELSIPFVGSSLWAYVVARGTPTYSTDTIVAIVNTFHE